MALAGLLAACTPTFDWRDVRPAGTGAKLLFPCKPTPETRTAKVAGSAVRMTMWSCTAGGATFALAHADVGEAGRAAGLVTDLLRGQVTNLQAQASPVAPPKVPGLAASGLRFRLEGRLPDGGPLQQRLFYFQRGAHVFQAAVLGAVVDEASADTFFESVDLSAP